MGVSRGRVDGVLMGWCIERVGDLLSDGPSPVLALLAHHGLVLVADLVHGVALVQSVRPAPTAQTRSVAPP